MQLTDYAAALGAARQLVPDLASRDLSLRIGAAQAAQAEAQTLARQQEQADTKAFRTDIASLSAKPTGSDYRRIAARHPRYFEQVSKVADSLDTSAKQGVVSNLAQLGAAITGGHYDIAKTRIQRHIDADKAAGRQPDENDTELLELLNSGDPEKIKGAGVMIHGMLAALDKNAADAVAPETDEVASTGDNLLYVRKGPHAGVILRDAPTPPQYKTVKNADGTESVVELSGEGGGPASSGGAAGTKGDVSRLINSDAGGGYVPSGVKTVGQFIGWGKSLNQRGAKSSSAGTYQINGSTMAEFAPQALGPNWQSAPFNAATQDKVGAAIFDWAKRQPDPAGALRGRWVSLDQKTAAQLVGGSWEQARGTIARFETGGGAGASASATTGPPGARVVFTSQGGPAAGDAVLDSDTIGTMAEQYLAGDPSVLTNLGHGRQGATNIVKLRAEIARQAKAKGMTGAQIAGIMQDYKTHQQALNAFAKGPEARTVRSLNVTIDHLDTLQAAAQALQNGNLQIFNKVANLWARGTGGAAPTNFAAVRQIVATEVAKAIAGGQTALADRQEIAAGISSSNSPQQLAGYIAEAKKLLAGQMQGLADQYKTGTGRDDFGDRLSGRTKRALGWHGQTGSSGGFRVLGVRPKQ